MGQNGTYPSDETWLYKYSNYTSRSIYDLRSHPKPNRCRLLQHIHPLPNKLRKVKPNIPQHRRMVMRLLHTFLPKRAILIDATQLPRQDDVEIINMLFRPLHASRHKNLREALLVYVNGVFDDGEVDEGDLEDVVG